MAKTWRKRAEEAWTPELKEEMNKLWTPSANDDFMHYIRAYHLRVQIAPDQFVKHNPAIRDQFDDEIDALQLQMHPNFYLHEGEWLWPLEVPKDFLIEVMFDAIEILTKKQKFAIIEYFFEEKTYRQIAADNGGSHQNYHKLVERALKRMKKFVAARVKKYLEELDGREEVDTES